MSRPAPAYPPIRPVRYRLLRGALRMGFRLVARLRLVGLEHCPRRGPALVVVNHLSYFDGPLVFAMLPLRVHPLAAAQYRRSLFAPFLSVAGPIYVRRGRPDRAAHLAARALLEDGESLAVAIEGTRSQSGRLQAGKDGVAYLAASTGVPVIPAAVWGTERIRTSWWRLRRPEVGLRVGPVLDLADEPLDVALLHRSTDRIMQSIAALLPASYLPSHQASETP